MSTCVSDIDYDSETNTLTVSFVKGGSHTYQDVPAKVVERFKAAGSKGSFFNNYIRSVYD